MNLQDIAKKLEGLQTVLTIAKNLNVKERTAINYAWKLRKEGYLKNMYGRTTRIYQISALIKKRKGYSLYELLNENSRVKIAVNEDYIIHYDKKPSIEEILVRAVSTGEFRVVLASIGLFNKITNWSRLRYFAKKYNLERKIGALYDVAKEIIRVRRMDEKTRKCLMNSKGTGYIIENLKSKSFIHIEKRWNVYIPFNKSDLEVYKE